MIKQIKLRSLILTFFFLVLFFLIKPVNGYTTEIGIEDGDVVKLSYEMYVDEIIEDRGTGEFKVSPKVIIQGFYEGLLGMKIGERKNITVPPEKGYSSGKLANKTMIFNTVILDLIENIRGDAVNIINSTSSSVISTVNSTSSSVISTINPLNSPLQYVTIIFGNIVLVLVLRRIKILKK